MSQLMQLIHKLFPPAGSTASTTAAAAVTTALVTPFKNFAQQVQTNAAAAATNGAPVPVGIVDDIKQSASDAIGLLKTGVDTGIDDGAQAVADATTAYLTGIAGPLGAFASPADHALAIKGAAILKSVIDEILLGFQAKVAPKATMGQTAATASAAGLAPAVAPVAVPQSQPALSGAG